MKSENLKLPIPDLQKWFEENEAQMEIVKDASPSPKAGEIGSAAIDRDEINPLLKVTFDVDTDKITSTERQYD